ncbi:MAG: hypothetical protein V3574_03060 [Candidatus Moraniibacteriota bacterium]
MNKQPRIILSIFAIALGVFMIVFGEHDDSPGAQGIGLIMVIVGIINIYKIKG